MWVYVYVCVSVSHVQDAAVEVIKTKMRINGIQWWINEYCFALLHSAVAAARKLNTMQSCNRYWLKGNSRRFFVDKYDTRNDLEFKYMNWLKWATHHKRWTHEHEENDKKKRRGDNLIQITIFYSLVLPCNEVISSCIVTQFLSLSIPPTLSVLFPLLIQPLRTAYCCCIASR